MEIISGPGNWRKLRKSRSLTQAAVKIFIYLLIGISLLAFIRSKQLSLQTLISPILNFQSFSLENTVEKVLAGSKGTYGIVIKNLKTEESYTLNEHKVFEAGSLYKLWIMAEALRQIQAGQLKEDEVLSRDIAELNKKFNISSESAEFKEGTVSLSVKDALTQMITISHNYAALLLTEKIKLSSVASFLKENGFNESKVGTEGDSPKSTPSDIALFFEKLYKEELINSPKMLELLKKQQLNDKLPKYLPKEVAVAHKTGEIGFYTHDGGIIFTPKGDYIIVVLSESDYPSGAADRIAQISRVVYDYFDKRQL